MAGKYTDDISEYILDNINIIDLISEYTPLKRAGSSSKGLCPFHNEKSPSFVVSNDKQLYHCFGCGVAGNAIGFIMEKENLDFIDAIEYLSEKYNIDISGHRTNNKEPKIIDHKKEIYAVNREAAIIFYKNLYKEQKAMDYVKKREINAEVAKKFGIGYSTDSWDGLVKAIGVEKSNLMDKAGLVSKKRDGSGFVDRFRDRLMFPIIDVRGNILGFGGRVFGDEMPKYLNSPETQAFNKSKTLYGLNIAKDHLHDKKQLIVVEGYMDVIALHQQGVKNVVATLGTALTLDHGRILDRYATEVILCFDGDSAGRKAALRSIEVLKNIKAKIKILTLPNKMDPDEYIKKNGKDGFLRSVEASKLAIEYKLDVMKFEYNLNAKDSVIDYLKSASGIIKNLGSDVEKNYYIEKLSTEFKYDKDALKREVYGMNFAPEPKKEFVPSYKKKEYKGSGSGKYNNYNKPEITKVDIDISGIDKIDQYEKKLLELSFQGKTVYSEFRKYIDINELRNENVKKMFEILEIYYRALDVVTIESILEMFGADVAMDIDKYLKKMILSHNAGKDILSIISLYEIEIITNKINALKARRRAFEITEAHAIPEDEANEVRLNFVREEAALIKMKRDYSSRKDVPRGGKSNG